MEDRNSRKSNSRRPSSGNSNKGGSYNKASSSGNYRKSDSGNNFKKTNSSFGGKSSGPKGRFEKRDDKSGFKSNSSGYGDKKPFKKSFGEGGSSFSKPRFTDGKPDFNRGKSNFGENKSFVNSDDRKPFKKPFGERKLRPSEDKPKREFAKDSDRKPFKRPFDDGERKDGFKKYDGEKRNFKTKTEGDTKSFAERKSAGEFERKAKRSFDDKRSDIKSKFVAKSRDEKFGNKDSKTPDYDKAFQPKETKLKVKRTAEEKADGIRLNRFIANSGVCSRRDADLLISAGEVTVNGVAITEMGFIVKPTDIVKYSGRTLKREKMVYVLLNKPKDFITTTNDPDDRRTVMDLVAGAAKERLFPVGRLDRNTTGLLLLTNDGDLAEKLSHPSNKIKKIYQVTLDRPLEDNDFEKIKKGVHLEDGVAEVDDIAIITKDKINLGLEIHIGRNRIVRRIFESLNYNVEKLDRVLYAELTKKDLPRGNWRYLTEQEVIRLKTRK